LQLDIQSTVAMHIMTKLRYHSHQLHTLTHTHKYIHAQIVSGPALLPGPRGAAPLAGVCDPQLRRPGGLGRSRQPLLRHRHDHHALRRGQASGACCAWAPVSCSCDDRHHSLRRGQAGGVCCVPGRSELQLRRRERAALQALSISGACKLGSPAMKTPGVAVTQ
jgi:hypothetical protein